MIGKITFVVAMLASGLAFAQQPNGSQTAPNSNTPAANQCWDVTTNQVRNKMAQPGSNQPSGTVGAGNSKTEGSTNQSPNAGPSVGNAANRPAGMPNC